LLPPKAEAETLGGIVARRATIKCQHRDFVQNRFEFCPKDTANLQFLILCNIKRKIYDNGFHQTNISILIAFPLINASAIFLLAEDSIL
jgi:hypothetical protein